MRIVRPGGGSDLPTGGSEVFASVGVTGTLRPDSIRIVGAETLCQKRLPLRAVGLDSDGSIRPINDLSYKPSHGWAAEYAGYFSNLGSPGSAGESALSRRNRELAELSVFRWYAVAGDASGRISAPGFGSLKSPESILPLRTERLEFGEDSNGNRRALPPIVEGVFYPGGEDLGNTAAYTLYTDAFEIDADLGVVKFAHPVVGLSATGETLPAELYLTTAFPVRNSGASVYEHEVVEESLAGASHNTGPMVVTRPDMRRRVIETYNGNGAAVSDNRAAFRKEAKAHIATLRRQWEARAGREVRYAGIVPIEPDGSREIAWSVDKDLGAETVVRRV